MRKNEIEWDSGKKFKDYYFRRVKNIFLPLKVIKVNKSFPLRQ